MKTKTKLESVKIFIHDDYIFVIEGYKILK
jgi:hypothetical protein